MFGRRPWPTILEPASVGGAAAAPPLSTASLTSSPSLDAEHRDSEESRDRRKCDHPGCGGGNYVAAGASPEILAARRRNLDVHRRVVRAVAAREVPTDLLAPQFRMENRVSAVTDYEYRGAGGFRDWMNDLFEVFAGGASYEVEEIIDVGDDYVVARFRISGRGGRSRLPLDFRWVGVTWFYDGHLTRAVAFASRAEALQAAQAVDHPKGKAS